jgi:hypothetical protein
VASIGTWLTAFLFPKKRPPAASTPWEEEPPNIPS